MERYADLLLTDDKKARNEAADLGFQCAYITDLLRLAQRRRIVASAAEIVEGLRSARIYLSFDTGQWQDWH